MRASISGAGTVIKNSKGTISNSERELRSLTRILSIGIREILDIFHNRFAIFLIQNTSNSLATQEESLPLCNGCYLVLQQHQEQQQS